MGERDNAEPSDPNAALDLARRLLADHPHDAIAAIDQALQSADAANSFRLLTAKGRALHDMDAPDRATDAFAAALAIYPDDVPALEQIILILKAAKRFAEANVYQARMHALQVRRLPARLADGLADIWQRIGNIELDTAAVEWAWEFADKTTWERSAWEAAAAWGKEARLLLRNWWETAPTQHLNQLAELVLQPDLRELRAALIERNACVLVGAHVGPTAVPVHLFHRANWPFRTLGTANRDRADDETMMPIFANSIATMRTIVKELKSGTTIGLLADAAIARDRLAVPFLGRTVELPLQIPKLIQRYDTASFWCCPLWRDGKVIIVLERLPEPLPGEPRQEWCERWFAAYLAKLEPVMRGRPENLGLFSGIWSNVNAAVLLRRQQAAKDRR